MPKRNAAVVLSLLAVLWMGALPRPAPARATLGPVEIIGGPDASDDASGLEARAVAFIRGARRSLHAALYELGLPSVALAMREARDRGVDVRLFLETDNRKAAKEKDCLALLGDIPVRFDDRRTLMHDKFIIADGEAVWTGAANLTWTGCHLHYNEAVIVRHPTVARAYDDQFERLFDNAADAPPLAPVRIGDVTVRCAFAPGRDRLQPWLDAVSRAHRRIDVAAFSLTHRKLVDALVQRAREGLTVDVILDARLAHGPAGRRALARLREAGCAIHVGGPRPSFELLQHFGLPRGQDIKIHHKLLVADGQYVVTGSANLSANGFEHNDENVITLDGGPALARVYEGILGRAREASRDDFTMH